MWKSFNTRVFLILFLSGFAGVLSFLLVDLPAIIAHMIVHVVLVIAQYAGLYF